MQLTVTLKLRWHCAGHGDELDAPGLTTLSIPQCWCLLICKILMALNSVSGWEATASSHEQNQSNFTAPAVSKKLTLAVREVGEMERSRSFEGGNKLSSSS